MTLEEYFHSLNKEKEDDMLENENEYEEPLTSVCFKISTPAVEHYPKHETTVNLEWQEGATWLSVIWEIAKVLEAQYGYSVKEKLFFQVYNQHIIDAEDECGNPDLAKQMFTKELS